MKLPNLLLSFGGLFSLASLAASSTPVGSVTIYNDVSLQGDLGEYVNSYTAGTVQVAKAGPVSGGYAHGSATSIVNLLPSPSFTATAELDDPSTVDTEAFANSQVYYSVSVSGPDPSAIVPIDIFSGDSLSANATGNAYVYVYAYLSVEGAGVFIDQLQARDSGVVESGSPIPSEVTFNLSVGSASAVTCDTYAEAQNDGLGAFVGTSYNGGGGSGSGSAALDPFFKIDPSFANASEYTLNVTPGVGNSSTPAPAAALPFIFGALVRRRRVMRHEA